VGEWSRCEECVRTPGHTHSISSIGPGSVALPSARVARALVLAAVLVAGACAPAPATDPIGSSSGSTAPLSPGSSPAPAGPGDFSSQRAWWNLEKLVGSKPRPAGSPRAAKARRYLTHRLAASGLQTEELTFDVELPDRSVRQVTSLMARLGGASEDLLIVAAPYTSPEREDGPTAGANQGGSGAAVALELARALAEGERSYTFLFLFISGDGMPGDPLAGSRKLAEAIARRGLLARARAGLFLDRIGAAELRIARDLNSSGPYRDIVWNSARELGHASAFVVDEFDMPMGGHRVLRAAGLTQVVALIEPASLPVSGLDPVGRARSDELADCTERSLGIVGEVALDALGEIESRLARIDRYARAPAEATRDDARERRAAALRGAADSTPSAADEGAGRP